MLKKIHSVAIYVVCSLLPVMATEALAIETGLASYYSDKFQGRKTASGQQYDRNKLTAAHRTLPIGSQIEVTNLKNQSSVIVTINDRGPYVGNRTLDLSYAAAKELGLVTSGVAPVAFNMLGAEKNSDFEKIIPTEYSPGALGLAQSEEEVIEAEEELASSEKSTATSVTNGTEKTGKSHAKHQTKKTVEAAEKTADASKHKQIVTATHAEKEQKSQKTTKSDNSKSKHDSKHPHLADKSEKSSHSHKHNDSATAHAEKELKSKKIAKSDNSESKTKKLVKSDKSDKKHSKSKKA
jgi:rare lipoprotein A